MNMILFDNRVIGLVQYESLELEVPDLQTAHHTAVPEHSESLEPGSVATVEYDHRRPIVTRLCGRVDHDRPGKRVESE